MKGIGRYGRCLDLYTSESELIARLNVASNVLENGHIIEMFLDYCMDELDIASMAAEPDIGYIRQLGEKIGKYNEMNEPYSQTVKRAICGEIPSLRSKLDDIKKKRGQK